MPVKAISSFARLRRILLGTLLALAAALAGLYQFGRQGTGGQSPEAGVTSSPGLSEREDVVALSEAFDFTQTLEGEPVFSLHGDSFASGRDALVELSGVRLEIYRNAAKYSVSARRATYDPNTKEAALLGAVRLTGQDGLSVASERMTLGRGGQLLEAEGPVRMTETQRFEGSAGSLEFDIGADLLSLGSPVHLESLAPAMGSLVFETGRLEYERGERLLRLPQALIVTRGESRIQAGRGELFLAADESSPAFLSLRSGVAGTLSHGTIGSAEERTILVQASRLTLRFAAAGGDAVPEEATLEGQGRELALLESVGGEGELIQGLASRGWVVRFAAGTPVEAESSSPVYFAEYHRGVEAAVRSGRAGSGRAEFASTGGVERVALSGDVTLEDPQFRAVGERALFDVVSGRAEILGPQARVATKQGDLSAPHLVYTRATGILSGSGGVRAVLRDAAKGALSGLAWSGSEPVQVEAREATLQEAPRSFSFSGDVRAWQGRNLLFAEQLRGEEAGGSLAAANGVRTVWHPQPTAGGAASTGSGAADVPIEVLARTLSYRRDERRLLYEDDVRVTQGERYFTCDELIADLDPQNRIQKMVGSGGVHLRDPEAGRTIDADSAEYEVASGSVLMSGDLVTMKDAQGGVLRGKRLIYNLESGSARLLGAGT